jgi:hypothetical protein
MIYAIIISASIVWAALALFSPWFNHLDGTEKETRTNKDNQL